MLRSFLAVACLLLLFFTVNAQQPASLTVEKIMRDPKWIGTSPSNINWSNDGSYLTFNWNPDKAPADSMYYITLANKIPAKASAQQKSSQNVQSNYNYNEARTAYVVAKDGDIFYTDVKTGRTKRIVQTTDNESNPQFSFNETKIVYNRNQNLYAWDIATGETQQLTNVKSPDPNAGGPGSGQGPRSGGAPANPQEQWLKNDQLQYFQVLARVPAPAVHQPIHRNNG